MRGGETGADLNRGRADNQTQVTHIRAEQAITEQETPASDMRNRDRKQTGNTNKELKRRNITLKVKV